MAKCTACNLHRISLNPCLLGIGGEHAKIMFIQDAVDSIDDKQNCQFIGNSISWFKRALENRGINPMEDCYYTSLVKCVYEDPDNLPNQSIRICSAYLESEIEIVDPDIIVPMGNKSLKFFLGKIGITKVRGNAQETEVLGRKRVILPILHPKFIPKRPGYKEYVIKDLNTLQSIFEQGIQSATGVTYKYLETLDEVRTELTRLNGSNRLVFDLETTGKSPYIEGAKIVCISLSDKPKYGVVIPLYKHDTPFNKDELKQIHSMLKLLLENPAIQKCAHNGKFDMSWLRVNLSINVSNYTFDTLAAHYIAISEEKGTQGLKSQAWEFTDIGGYDNELDEYRNSLSDGEGLESRFNYDRIPWVILREYAAADADCCMRLWDLYKPLIEENPKWNTLYNDIVIPAIYALMDIEINGMLFDRELSGEYKDSYEQEIQRITDRLNTYPEVLEIQRDKLSLFKERERIKTIPKKDRTEEEQRKFTAYKKYEDFHFNWNSVSQLRELLYDRLHLSTSFKTDKGDPSTSEEALEDLKLQHEIPSLLLELRKVSTLNGLFIQKLPTLADSNDLVHSSYNMTGCIVGSSLVLTEKGLIHIENLIQNPDYYSTVNTDLEAVSDTVLPPDKAIKLEVNIVNGNRQFEQTSYGVIYYNQSTLKVSTQIGLSIEGTYNHPIITNLYDKVKYSSTRKDLREEVITNMKYWTWSELQDITPDSLIAVMYNTQIFGKKLLKLPLILDNSFEYPRYLNEDLALFLGIYKAIGNYTNGTVIMRTDNETLIRVCCRLALKLFNTVSIIKDNTVTIQSEALVTWTDILELSENGIPNFILEAPKEIQVAYLKGLFVRGYLTETSTSPIYIVHNDTKTVLETAQVMLLNLGLISTFSEKFKILKTYYYEKLPPKYTLKFIGTEYLKLKEIVGEIIQYTLSGTYTYKTTTSYYIDNTHNLLWLKVNHCKRSNNTVYDLNVPNTHSFIVNSFISHNTVTGRLSSENPKLIGVVKWNEPIKVAL